MLQRLTGVTLLVFAIHGTALAQTGTITADVAGVVRSQTEAVIPAAQITLVNSSTNISRSVLSDARGRFTIPALPPGTYSLREELAGFDPYPAFRPSSSASPARRSRSTGAGSSGGRRGRRENVVLTIGSLIEINVTLAVAGHNEQIAVQAQPPPLDVGRIAVSSVVRGEQIENLPINGRSFLSFALLTPAVTTDRTPQQGASVTAGLNFSGQSARLNNITVDGVDNNEQSAGGVRPTLSQEAVQEFQVLTNSFSAEFGRATGGVVNIVTKSGGNTPSGNAFFFFRDESLNAREYFEKFTPGGAPVAPPKAPYGQKQFGGTFGGPLRRDKTFSFFAFERLDISSSNFVTIDDHTPVTIQGAARRHGRRSPSGAGVQRRHRVPAV